MYIHVCKASQKETIIVAALHIHILGRMHWDSEMVRVKHLKYVFGSRKGGVTANCQYAWISQASWF